MPEHAARPRYAVVIQWSEEDNCYVASLPEWRPTNYCGAHGATYEEAAKNARETIEFLIESHDPAAEGPMPAPKLFSYPGADVINVPDEPAGQRGAGPAAQAAQAVERVR